MSAKVLVVDDDPTCNQFLTLLLEDEGFDVRGARCASEALEIANQFSPDILVADWLLKDGMDGAEVAQLLQKQFGGLKVIFTTGSPAEQLAEHVRSLPCARIMEKPIEIDELLGALNSLKAA